MNIHSFLSRFSLKQIFSEDSFIETPHPKYAKAVKDAMKSGTKIWLDVGCGLNKQKGSIGMDIRAHENVDIVHDIRELPLPIPDEICYRVLLSHLVEHLPPDKVLYIFDELWRITIPNGQLLIAAPYAGTPRFWQDPTHIHSWNEVTPQYFDPTYPLWHVYQAKPWKIETNEWQSYGDLTCILAKRESADIEDLAPSPYEQPSPQQEKTEIKKPHAV